MPWNDLPPLPIKKELYETVDILKKLGDAKASLAKLQGRSVVIPNQALIINTISLQEAKLSSEIENIFTTDDELYKAYSDQDSESIGASKEVLRYREALWSGFNYLKEGATFSQEYFTKVNHLVNSGMYAEKTARKYLNELCDMQVLEKKVLEGKHYYLNLELYRILSEQHYP